MNDKGQFLPSRMAENEPDRSLNTLAENNDATWKNILVSGRRSGKISCCVTTQILLCCPFYKTLTF